MTVTLLNYNSICIWGKTIKRINIFRNDMTHEHQNLYTDYDCNGLKNDNRERERESDREQNLKKDLKNDNSIRTKPKNQDNYNLGNDNNIINCNIVYEETHKNDIKFQNDIHMNVKNRKV